MINSFSVAGAGAGAAATAAITLHFNYSNNNNNNNNSSGIKIVPAASNEHKSQSLINNAAPATTKTETNTTTTPKIFQITQTEAEAKHFLMAFPQQQQQQQQQQPKQKAGASLKWMPPGKVNTSASTKEPQLRQVSIQSSNNSSSSSSSSNNKQQQLQPATTTTGLAKSAFIEAWTMPQQQQQRTEDQENAFRQIEDVHNYAKLSSELGEEDEEDDDDDDDDEEEEDEDDDEEEERQPTKKTHLNVPNNTNDDDSEEHVEVDVVTVTPTATTVATAAAAAAAAAPQLQLQQEQLMSKVDQQEHMRPEHHARRPMNAFLIFCKRHRAIVKERYKSLENRAITKILGDWWAALDEQEKQCFTDLAQQNKDAFFNANPNFKWYKLPAPPLRTLATRPSNAPAGQMNEEQLQPHPQQQLQWAPNDVAHMLRSNYFKFADETQMGELSALLSANAGSVPDKDYALQQVLSETTQFLSTHMPNNNNNNSNNCNNNKRLLDSGSNSSEEEERGTPNKKLKTARSCKGKIYQELINSGQLAAIAKKSKCRLNSGGSSNNDANSNTPPISPTNAVVVVSGGQLVLPVQPETTTALRVVAANEFDLEEKIRELPALSLDAYLQRKRSTKKKKKFSSSKKQRNPNFNSNTSSSTPAATAAAAAATVAAVSTATAATVAAVGSQKRKARKESITRRDVSAIEQEVASILPLTINGCYYFNETRAAAAAATVAATTATATTVAASPPLSSSSSSTLSAYEQAGYDVTTTSDLLILAEVAANRTELTKSN
ncbi:myb-like protein AA [Drosophila novamexicana]|uniref:myb-like protein AA n=1 Tax=Drosophila novamexicana TaxID=47314 RepID=UPI0011E5B8CF|nr:myb-like protein AA [Drosophila novamexicana]